MTSASHAEGRQFNPGWVYFLSVLLPMLHEIHQLTNGFFDSNSFLGQDWKSFRRLVDPKVGSRQSMGNFHGEYLLPILAGLGWTQLEAVVVAEAL